MRASNAAAAVPREFDVNQRNPRQVERLCGGKGEGFPDNYVKTSKYNLINFLPLNLLKQFRQMANLYFLLIVVMECIPQVTSAGNPMGVVMALSMVVGISVIKDAYEDYQRVQADREENTRNVLAIPIGHRASLSHAVVEEASAYAPQ